MANTIAIIAITTILVVTHHATPAAELLAVHAADQLVADLFAANQFAADQYADPYADQLAAVVVAVSYGGNVR